MQTIRPITISNRFHIQSQKCRLGFTLHNYDQTLIIPKLVVTKHQDVCGRGYSVEVFCWTPNAICTVCWRLVSLMFACGLLLFCWKVQHLIYYICAFLTNKSWPQANMSETANREQTLHSAFCKIPFRKCVILKFPRRDLGVQVKHHRKKKFTK